jgi:hypothetical protein
MTKDLVMARLYSLKCHLLGLQVQSDATKEVFPQRLLRVYIKLSGKIQVVPFIQSSSNLQ